MSQLIKQIVELEKIKEELGMEQALDLDELREKRKEIEKKIDEIKKRIKPKKEKVILKAAPAPVKTSGYQIRGGQNNFPYSKEALKKNFENRKKYFEKFNASKRKKNERKKSFRRKKSLRI